MVFVVRDHWTEQSIIIGDKHMNFATLSDASDKFDTELIQLAGCASSGELQTTFRGLLETHGVSAFSVSSKRTGATAPKVHISTLPEAVRSICDGLFLMNRHPLTKLASEQRLPLPLEAGRALFEDDPLAQSWFDCIEAALDDRTLVCIPVWSADKQTFAFLLAVDEAAFGAAELLVLQTICQAYVIENERIQQSAGLKKSDYILTARERECLQLSSLGLTEKRIALSIDISPNTVRVHIENAKRRLGAANKSHAIVLAVVHREIDLPAKAQVASQAESSAALAS